MKRLSVLMRLNTVYSLIENLHAIEAKLASTETSIVENAMDMEANYELKARAAKRDSVEREDDLGRSAMSVKEEIAARRRAHLEPILREKRSLSEAAHARYRESHLWSERIKRLVDLEKKLEAYADQRRFQIDSDDRFLARRRIKMRSNHEEIKIS